MYATLFRVIKSLRPRAAASILAAIVDGDHNYSQILRATGLGTTTLQQGLTTLSNLQLLDRDSEGAYFLSTTFLQQAEWQPPVIHKNLSTTPETGVHVRNVRNTNSDDHDVEIPRTLTPETRVTDNKLWTTREERLTDELNRIEFDKPDWLLRTYPDLDRLEAILEHIARREEIGDPVRNPRGFVVALMRDPERTLQTTVTKRNLKRHQQREDVARPYDPARRRSIG